MAKLNYLLYSPARHLLDVLVGLIPIFQYYYSDSALTQLYYTDDGLSQALVNEDF